jgi:hypothetical protein
MNKELKIERKNRKRHLERRSMAACGSRRAGADGVDMPVNYRRLRQNCSERCISYTQPTRHRKELRPSGFRVPDLHNKQT